MSVRVRIFWFGKGRWFSSKARERERETSIHGTKRVCGGVTSYNVINVNDVFCFFTLLFFLVYLQIDFNF